MPTYVYEVILPDGNGGDTFEIIQGFRDPELTVHPETGEPVRRVLTAPNVMGKWSDTNSAKRLSNKNLDRLGFTKYEKKGDGVYEKAAGKGPNVIRRGEK